MIKSIFYIEAQARSEPVVKDALKELVEQMKNEKNVRVKRTKFEEVLEEGNNYSSVVEVDAEFDDFLDYLLAAIKYGPSAIIVSAPEKLFLDRQEFLKALGEVARITKDFFEEYNIGYKLIKEGKTRKKVGLSQDEIDDLLEEGALRIKLVIEAAADSEDEAVKTLLDSFENDVMINKVKAQDLEKTDGFKGLIGVEVFVYDAKSVFDLVVKHRPLLIELVEPMEVELDILDIQDIGVDLAGVFFEASHKLAHK